MPSRAGTYWSSCCGEPAEYLGYYRCTGCTKALHLGREREPHLLSAQPGQEAKPRDVQPMLPIEATDG